MSRHRRHRHRRRSSPSRAGPAIALAGVAVLAVMGVTEVQDRSDTHHLARRVPSSVPAPQPMEVVPTPAKVRVLTGLQRLDKTLREAERGMPALRHAKRGVNFETVRVALLAQVSQARDDLGIYLDAHPNDDHASRLWDRAVRAYVALKKL